MGLPCRLGLIHRSVPFYETPPFVKFGVHFITFNMLYFEHHPGERCKRSAVAAGAVSTTTVATIAAVANNVGSQQWQWWGQATAAEIEAAVGAHNNQLTDGSDSDIHGVRGGGQQQR